jgi:hypothetical protein
MNELAKKCSTDKNKKPFEPPMNIDEHRLKTDKKRCNFKYQHNCMQYLDKIWCVTSQTQAVVGTNPWISSRKLWNETMGSSFGLGEASLRPLENQRDIMFIFIASLSVFIGVHRWLELLCFNLSNRDLSVDACVGACDAFVCA